MEVLYHQVGVAEVVLLPVVVEGEDPSDLVEGVGVEVHPQAVVEVVEIHQTMMVEAVDPVEEGEVELLLEVGEGVVLLPLVVEEEVVVLWWKIALLFHQHSWDTGFEFQNCAFCTLP